MPVVDHRPYQAYRDGFDLCLPQAGDHFQRLPLIQRGEHLAFGGKPFADLECQRPRDIRFRVLLAVVEQGAASAALA